MGECCYGRNCDVVFVPSIAYADVTFLCRVRTRAQTYMVLHDTGRATWHGSRFYHLSTSSASHICSPMECFFCEIGALPATFARTMSIAHTPGSLHTQWRMRCQWAANVVCFLRISSWPLMYWLMSFFGNFYKGVVSST